MAKNETWKRISANVNSKLGFERAKEAWSVLKGVNISDKR